jgi:hypothetical protein
MACKVAGRPGRRVVGEIRQGADDGHPDVWPDPHCDHILFDNIAEADASVDAFRDNIGQVCRR